MLETISRIMKRAPKSRSGERIIPLIWRDCSWTLRVNVRPVPPCSREKFNGLSSRRGNLPFSPFRGFHFSQLAVQKI